MSSLLPPRLGIYGQTVRQLAAVDPDTGEILDGGPPPADALTLDQKRRRKYARARTMAALLQHKDLAGCHAWMQCRTAPVVVHHKPAVQRSGFFTGLQTCGLVHLCAHCQPKIASRRAREVQQAIDAWRSTGGDVLMVTLTLSHGRADPLADTLAALKDAGRRLQRHRTFTGLADAGGLVGRIVATELTHGSNGWHPHQHQLWFVRPGADHGQLRQALTPAWQASLVKAGFAASDAHGVRVNGAEHAAQYVAKMSSGDRWTLADEMTRAGSKSGRNGSLSVWQLVDLHADRSAPVEDRHRAAALLQEYAMCITGTKALSWSPGLKRRFLVDDVSDADLAEEVQEDDTMPLAAIESWDWPKVAHHRVQAEVLTIAEDEGPAALGRFVELLPAVPPREEVQPSSRRRSQRE